MITYYAGTLFDRVWVLEDVHGQPLASLEGLTAEVIIKKSFDSEEQLLLIASGENLVLTERIELNMTTLDLTVPELELDPGDYVFYCVVLNPNRQVIECTNLTVLANHNAPEVTP